MTEHSLPAWTRELQTLLPACSQFLLSGNIHDQFFIELDQDETPVAEAGTGERQLRDVVELLTAVFKAQGFESVFTYHPEDEPRATLGDAEPHPVSLGSLESLATAIEKAVQDKEHRSAVIVLSASRLVRDLNQLSDEGFAFFRRMDRLARTPRVPFNPVVWLLDRERDVPDWFAIGNEYLRSIVLPLPHAGERTEYAERLVQRLDDQEAGLEERDAAADVLSQQTAGLTLTGMERTISIAQAQALKLDQVEDAARSYRVGVIENPWKAEYLRTRLANELKALEGEEWAAEPTPESISSRVFGQQSAVRKTLDILVRSVTGMTAAQASPSATRPRGVLFFAGPTGVGKTEVAKAVTKLLFDDERFYLRFDMSEFSAEHAADRLIGAPPGYVGHEAGGELTDAIRQRPFSLVLFDEIEKAHPLILDKFLQILDDGRLTDGRGDTVYFTEALLVFTSNLGIVDERAEEGDEGRRRLVRERLLVRKDRFEEGMTYDKMAAQISEYIQKHIELRLGRPELLNRIGVDNIVVFDFISDTAAKQILTHMLGNITKRVEQEHQLTIEIHDETSKVIERACLDADVLELGGRGIGSRLETVVINPLARQLFIDSHQEGTYSLALTERDDEWSAKLHPA